MKNQKGAVVLFTVLIVGLSAVTGFFTLSQASIGIFSEVQQQTDAMNAQARLIGCLDELLLQLQVDNNFSATEIDIQTGICDIVITTISSNEREVTIEETVGRTSKGMHVELTIDPFEVTALEERL